MNIEISAAAREVLLELLQTEMGEVRQEVHHTKTHEFRDKLKAREAVVRELIEKLGGEISHF